MRSPRAIVASKSLAPLLAAVLAVAGCESRRRAIVVDPPQGGTEGSESPGPGAGVPSGGTGVTPTIGGEEPSADPSGVDAGAVDASADQGADPSGATDAGATDAGAGGGNDSGGVAGNPSGSDSGQSAGGAKPGSGKNGTGKNGSGKSTLDVDAKIGDGSASSGGAGQGVDTGIPGWDGQSNKGAAHWTITAD
jgi:hypothetical protein